MGNSLVNAIAVMIGRKLCSFFKEEIDVFKVGDKVRIVQDKLKEGCHGVAGNKGVITLKENTEGLMRSGADVDGTIYPFPTVNVDCGGAIWKVNLDAVELVDEKTEKDLELWKSAEKRYNRIYEILKGVLMGMYANGCDTLGIPECDFCKEICKENSIYNIYNSAGCKKCAWAQVMDECCSGCSSWNVMREKIIDALDVTDEILTKINAQIAKMEKADEV